MRRTPLLAWMMMMVVVEVCVAHAPSAKKATATKSAPATKTAGKPAPSAKVTPKADPKPATKDTAKAAKKDKPPSADAKAKAKQGKPAAKPAESPRLQKLKKLTFDRKASSILKAWSTPPESASEKAEAKEPDDAKGADGKSAPKKTDPLDAELATFQRHVTLGAWDEAKAYLASLPEKEAKAGYEQLLKSLKETQSAKVAAQRARIPAQYVERNEFSPSDVLALAELAPMKLEPAHLDELGAILKLSVDGGAAIDHTVALLDAEAKKPDDSSALTRRQTAIVLMAAQRPIEAGGFLPDLASAVADNDHEALNLLARHFVALHEKEKKTEFLEKAWDATQSALAAEAPEKKHQEEALRRAVELAPRLRDELGARWLAESFTTRSKRGKDILTTIGSLAASGLQRSPTDPSGRLAELKLQKTAIEALLRAEPETAAAWRDTLDLLARNWLREAKFAQQFATSSSLGPRMQRDSYGNFFFGGGAGRTTMNRQQNNQPQAIDVKDILDVAPQENWLQHVEPALKPGFAVVSARLYLKVGAEEEAFPFIEGIAKTQPDEAKKLVDEFLRVWTRNHDPNANRRRTNPYVFMWGYERRAESIPLTRSKQQRDLVELTEWVGKLRGLPVGGLDEKLLADAFTSCHSSAEVYRLEAIEKVFGSLDGLKPATLAAMVQKMRENLAGQWRQPAVQKRNKTKRKASDIRLEVERGYRVAGAVVDDGLAKYPDAWSLALAKAALLLDENDYRQELEKSSEFTERRAEALAAFRKAAELYAEAAPKLAEDDESAQAYQQWFYAGLGASDLGRITEDKQADARQPELIRAAILALPGPAAERHLGKFANALFTRMSAVKPAVKFRYLNAGFQIVGDHEQAYEAKKLYEYYSDLVTEIKLDAVVDGSDAVGHERPFGLFVNLRHTREIERESGGFGRYLQNQSSGQSFYYNYGRPLSDYRDRFETAARQALEEHFEVLSVTFQTPEVASKATAEYGWRITPYAYLLLKARGPQVDRLAPLRVDLDFLDTSGYVILPIESPAVPIVASQAVGDPRPAANLDVMQTLDERQARDGKLVLEIKATANGLVPPLEDLLEIQPQEFDVVATEDQGLAVSHFDKEGDGTTVVSERDWLLTLRAKPDLKQPPGSFRFATALRDDAKMTYQRYVDADLLEVEPVLSLEQEYAAPDYAPLWAGLGALVIVAATGIIFLRRLRRPRHREESAWPLPDHLTPFTVIGYLERIRDHNGLDAKEQKELAVTLSGLEQRFFAEADAPSPDHPIDQPDLRDVAERWRSRVSS